MSEKALAAKHEGVVVRLIRVTGEGLDDFEVLDTGFATIEVFDDGDWRADVSLEGGAVVETPSGTWKWDPGNSFWLQAMDSEEAVLARVMTFGWLTGEGGEYTVTLGVAGFKGSPPPIA